MNKGIFNIKAVYLTYTIKPPNTSSISLVFYLRFSLGFWQILGTSSFVLKFGEMANWLRTQKSIAHTIVKFEKNEKVREVDLKNRLNSVLDIEK